MSSFHKDGTTITYVCSCKDTNKFLHTTGVDVTTQTFQCKATTCDSTPIPLVQRAGVFVVGHRKYDDDLPAHSKYTLFVNTNSTSCEAFCPPVDTVTDVTSKIQVLVMKRDLCVYDTDGCGTGSIIKYDNTNGHRCVCDATTPNVQMNAAGDDFLSCVSNTTCS